MSYDCQNVKLESKDEETPIDYADLLKDTQEDKSTVQIIGLDGYVHANTFMEAFARIAATQKTLSPSDFTVVTESNYNFEHQGTRFFAAADQFFIKFKSEAEACYVLGLEKINIFQFICRIVQFAKPTQNTATRAAYRKIAEIKARLPKINDEYASIGAFRKHTGKPSLPTNYKNKAWFMQDDRIPAIDRKRKAGIQLDNDDMHLLKGVILADTDQLNARIDALYDEESDAWLTLRKYQLAGLKFPL